MFVMPYKKAVKITLLCLLAAAANYFLNTLSVHVLRIPLYLDTVFSAAVCFGAGLIPGLITALLSYVFWSIWEGGFTPFVICSIAEVVIVWRLKPEGGLQTKGAFVRISGSLLLLYISACITISVLGGLIDFIYHSVFSVEKFYFSPEDTVKISLLRSGIHTLAMNILSRIPINVVDRFIVIFGGYFIAKGLSLCVEKTERIFR